MTSDAASLASNASGSVPPSPDSYVDRLWQHMQGKRSPISVLPFGCDFNLQLGSQIWVCMMAIVRSTGRCATGQFSTHIWSTYFRIWGLPIRCFPRIFGLHLRINGLSSKLIMLILKRMRFSLYDCMNYPILIAVVAARIVENGLAGQRHQPLPLTGGKAPAALTGRVWECAVVKEGVARRRLRSRDATRNRPGTRARMHPVPLRGT